jgi:predicted phage gp36 major capsid-like protein
LVLTDAVPSDDRDRAEFTIKKLQIQNSEWVIEQRQEWYRMYLQKELNLEGLEKKAPLIARAVKKQLNQLIFNLQ